MGATLAGALGGALGGALAGALAVGLGLGAPTDGDADGDADGDTDGDGDAEGLGVALGDGLGLADPLGDGFGLGLRDLRGPAAGGVQLCVGVGVADGPADADPCDWVPRFGEPGPEAWFCCGVWPSPAALLVGRTAWGSATITQDATATTTMPVTTAAAGRIQPKPPMAAVRSGARRVPSKRKAGVILAMSGRARRLVTLGGRSPIAKSNDREMLRTAILVRIRSSPLAAGSTDSTAACRARRSASSSPA